MVPVRNVLGRPFLRLILSVLTNRIGELPILRGENSTKRSLLGVLFVNKNYKNSLVSPIEWYLNNGQKVSIREFKGLVGWVSNRCRVLNHILVLRPLKRKVSFT